MFPILQASILHALIGSLIDPAPAPSPASQDPPPREVMGTLVERNGQPIAGAILCPRGARCQAWAVDHSAPPTTGPDGSFRLRMDGPYFHDIALVEPGGHAKITALPSGPWNLLDLGEIVAPEPLITRGTILGSDGEPLSGAPIGPAGLSFEINTAVSITSRPTPFLTSPDGGFWWVARSVPSGLVVRQPVGCWYLAMNDLDPRRPIQIPEVAWRSVTLVDERGAPASGVEIQWHATFSDRLSLASPVLQLGASSQLQVPRIEDLRWLYLCYRWPPEGHWAAVDSSEVGGSRIQIWRPIDFELEILTSNGEPVLDAAFLAETPLERVIHSSWDTETQEAESPRPGFYLLRGVQPSVAWIRADAPGHFPRYVDVRRPRKADLGTLELATRQKRELHLLDQGTGEPLAGLRIGFGCNMFRDYYDGCPYGFLGGSAITDASGWLRFECCDHPARVVILDVGLEIAKVVTKSGFWQVDAQLLRPARLTGAIAAVPSIASTSIVAVQRPQRRPGGAAYLPAPARESAVGEDGRFCFEDLPAGPWLVGWFRTAPDPLEWPPRPPDVYRLVLLEPGAEEEVVLDPMRPFGELAGRIRGRLLRGSEGVAGEIGASLATETVTAELSWNYDLLFVTRSGPDGAFSFELPAGRYTISADADIGAPPFLSGVRVAAGETTEIDVAAARMSVELVLVTPSGRPLADFAVALSAEDETNRRQIVRRTGMGGEVRFVLDSIKADSLRLHPGGGDARWPREPSIPIHASDDAASIVSVVRVPDEPEWRPMDQ